MTSEATCCVFTYESDRDWGVTRTALGIAYSWAVLCNEFHRQGSPCPATNVIHFRTISILGPKLFAVNLNNLKVFYHDGSQWHQYRSARNVRLGTLEDFMEFFYEGDNNNDDWSQEDNDGQDRDDDDEPGRQTKDLHSYNNSTYQMNQAILYYSLLRMFLFIQLQIYLTQYQSFIC